MEPALTTFRQLKDAVGNTPLVNLPWLSPKGRPDIRVFAKDERGNPTGSIKDRIAYALVEDVIARNKDGKINTLIEASSGNTGAALALAGKLGEFKTLIVVPSKTSDEKKRNIEHNGATLITAPEGQNYMHHAKELSERYDGGAFFVNQYDNIVNRDAHRKTGLEILQDMQEVEDIQNREIRAFIAAGSTGGTISGIGAAFKQANAKTDVVLADPQCSALYDLYYGLKGRDALWNGEGATELEGVGKNRKTDVIDFTVIDRVIKFLDRDALRMVDKAKEHGIKIGGSAGANFSIASHFAQEAANRGEGDINIVTVIPDGYKNYASKFEDTRWRTRILDCA